MSTPATKPTPNHKASLYSALTALFGSGATLAALAQFTNAHFPGVQAAITAAVVAVATFVGRYVPFLKRAFSFWRSVRKQKAVQPYVDAAINAYKASLATPAEVAAASVHELTPVQVAAASTPPAAATTPAPPVTTATTPATTTPAA